MCFGNNGCGGNSCLWIILILIIIWGCGGNSWGCNSNCGCNSCGCGNKCGNSCCGCGDSCC